MRKKRKLSKSELLDRQIASWEAKQEGAVIMLRKSAEMLLKLRRQRQRMLKRKLIVARVDENGVAYNAAGESIGLTGNVGPSGPVLPVSVEPVSVGYMPDIPAALDRTGKAKDEAARAEIKAQQDAEKKRKAERRIAKLKIGQEIKQAELTGARRKMPLSGKNALAAIRGE